MYTNICIRMYIHMYLYISIYIHMNMYIYVHIYIYTYIHTYIFRFVCPTEIIAFGDRQSEFDTLNAQVIAASCDSLFSHLAWCNTPRAEGGLGDMQIPIVADFNKEVATSYGVSTCIYLYVC
jgi:tryparedoxin peroxidase (2-Cys peroxiredoxin)